MENKFYITTPIYYVNDAPHLGHAYTTVAADVIARWNRQLGKDVWFLTGTDEHGEKIMRTAQEHNTTPQEWCDDLVETKWKPLWEHLQLSNDDFIRTTDKRHEAKVQEFVQKLYDEGYIYSGSFEGPYCVGCEEFKVESELIEEEGKLLCPIHKKPVENLKEENYFFKLSAFQDKLLKLYEANPDYITPKSARNEVVSFVSDGLQDLSISRSSFDWGVKVPWDDSQVIYVWVDALLNYWTALSDDEAKLEKFFPADMHVLGKDILRFHAVIWPAMLMAAGFELPKKIVTNGWLLVGGEKMSKSNLTGISPYDITSHFGVDAYRYYFMRALAFGSDGSFSWEDFTARYNAELANGLGNLASRVSAMIIKYFDGTLPKPSKETSREMQVESVIIEAIENAEIAIDEAKINEVLAAIWTIVDELNLYITEQEPWKLAKDDSEDTQAKLATTLYTAADGLRILAVLLHPFMPAVTERYWESLSIDEDIADQRIENLMATHNKLVPGEQQIVKPKPLFPRLESDK
ncbi:MAG: methionine--tRNA ligase [Micrococcaceae bacterium]